MADHRRGGAALSVLSHRSAPTTSAACCGRRALLDAPAPTTPPGRIDDAELRARRGRRDPRRRRACRTTSGCSRPPTASSAAPPGTWTSSTRSAGSSQADDDLDVHFRNAEGELDFTPAGAARRRQLGLDETIFGDDFAFLRATRATDVTPKLTIPSPSMVHYRGGAAAIDPAVYPDDDAFWADLSAAYADEVRRLGELGCTLPAVRRHQPRLPQRPRAARR